MVKYTKLIVLGAVTVLVGACGSVAEKATEIAIENATGSSLDVDLDTGDGSVTITDEETGEVIVGGIGSELPDGWPSDIPAPEGSMLISASSSPATGYVALWNWPNATRATLEEYVDALVASGYTKEGEPIVISGGNGFSITYSLVGKGRKVMVNGGVEQGEQSSLTVQAKDD